VRKSNPYVFIFPLVYECSGIRQTYNKLSCSKCTLLRQSWEHLLIIISNKLLFFLPTKTKSQSIQCSCTLSSALYAHTNNNKKSIKLKRILILFLNHSSILFSSSSIFLIIHNIILSEWLPNPKKHWNLLWIDIFFISFFEAFHITTNNAKIGTCGALLFIKLFESFYFILFFWVITDWVHVRMNFCGKIFFYLELKELLFFWLFEVTQLTIC